VDIGTLIAYKHGDSPWQPKIKEKNMASKKAAKKLKKTKKLQPTKPLTHG
jgi:hypothetical protein